jgi:microcystin-dependent protein
MSSKRSYITLGAFENDLFRYTTRVDNFETIGTLTAVGSGAAAECPKGRFLYENGRKIYPGTHPGVFTYMVGVYDPVSFLSGFVDPNSKVFAPMNTDRSYAAQVGDSGRGVFGTNPNGGTERDQGAGVMTLANCQFGANVDISGNVVTQGDSGVVGDVDISGNLVVHGTATFEDVTVNNLTIRGTATQIDIADMNSEQFSITNNGTGPALTVNQLGAQDIANFKDDGASVLIVKDGGNVGVGTTTPAYKLEVNGTFNASAVYQGGFLLVPPGSLMMYIAAAAPAGWLVCDGSAVSRATYAALYAVIGGAYGGGDGVNTFNVPDMRARAPVGSGTGGEGLTARPLAAIGGAETVTLTSDQMPGHTHTGTTSSDGIHSHTHNANGGYGGYGLVTANNTNTVTSADASENELNVWTNPIALAINNSSAHTHTFTTASTGGGGAHDNMQPFIVVNYIIKY